MALLVMALLVMALRGDQRIPGGWEEADVGFFFSEARLCLVRAVGSR